MSYQPPVPVAGTPRLTVAVLTKAPKHGLSKTRLVDKVSPGLAEILLQRLLRQTVGNAVSVSSNSYCIYWGGHDLVSDVLAAYPVTLIESTSPDLLDALYASIESLLTSQGGRLIVIASDSPSVEPSLLLRLAATLLDAEVCIVPSTDGGICALGTRISLPMPSMDEVSRVGLFGATIEELHNIGITPVVFEARTDIDDISGLRHALTSGQFSYDSIFSRFLEQISEDM